MSPIVLRILDQSVGFYLHLFNNSNALCNDSTINIELINYGVFLFTSKQIFDNLPSRQRILLFRF
jgi:hypothetical protein